MDINGHSESRHNIVPASSSLAPLPRCPELRRSMGRRASLGCEVKRSSIAISGDGSDGSRIRNNLYRMEYGPQRAPVFDEAVVHMFEACV